MCHHDQLDKILSDISISKENFGKLKLGIGLKILIILAVFVYVCHRFLFVYIQPDEYGIKVVRVGLNRGVQKEVFQAGLSFVLPFGLERMCTWSNSSFLPRPSRQ